MLGFAIVIDFLFYAFVLTSSSLSSRRIHSRSAKCWLMNCSFIQILELPDHIAHVRVSARKITPQNDTDPEWHSSCAPVLAPHPLASHHLWAMGAYRGLRHHHWKDVDEMGRNHCENWWLFFNLLSKPVHTQ